MDTNAHEYGECGKIFGGSSGLTVWWLVLVRRDDVRSIRVNSCSFVVQLNLSGLGSVRPLPELAAGGIDVATARTAEMRHHAPGPQLGDKCLGRLW